MYININEKISRCTNIPAEAKIILGFLKGFWDAKKNFYGGEEYISTMCGLPRWIVRDILNVLIKGKIIIEKDNYIFLTTQTIFDDDSWTSLFLNYIMDTSELKNLICLKEMGFNPQINTVGSVFLEVDGHIIYADHTLRKTSNSLKYKEM
jgi:hypothetical protein